jgi:site-specific DNA-methyltransferase (adenine-specific)
VSDRRKPTATSNFGVGKRENHDASGFYTRFTPPQISDDAIVAAPKLIDEIIIGDARNMDSIADNSVALVVTSPPYFAGKAYEEALGLGAIPANYLEYLDMLEAVFAECVRVLEPGGRIAVNVANLGRKPFRSLSADVTGILQDKLRLLLRGEIVWVKARAASGNCAWGSFQRPSNPTLRDLSERVVIASKGRFDRALDAKHRAKVGLPSASSMTRDEFMEATLDLWEIAPESARRVGHPAPFPVELPERLIHLYTFVDDLVLDPFMGSGSTGVAAVRTGRHFVGYELDADFAARARDRIAAEPLEATRFELPAVKPKPDGDEHAGARALGATASDVAIAMLERAGCTSIEKAPKLGAGITVSFRARDERGRAWLFELAGGFTAVRPGLSRSETLWRVIAKAAVVRELAADTPLIVLTADTATGANSGALAAVLGPGKPIHAVADLRGGVDALRSTLRTDR